MAYKALISFAGRVTMRRGEVKEIDDKTIANSLAQAGYVVEVNDGAKKKVSEVKAEATPEGATLEDKPVKRTRAKRSNKGGSDNG